MLLLYNYLEFSKQHEKFIQKRDILQKFWLYGDDRERTQTFIKQLPLAMFII